MERLNKSSNEIQRSEALRGAMRSGASKRAELRRPGESPNRKATEHLQKGRHPWVCHVRRSFLVNLGVVTTGVISTYHISAITDAKLKKFTKKLLQHVTQKFIASHNPRHKTGAPSSFLQCRRQDLDLRLSTPELLCSAMLDLDTNSKRDQTLFYI